MAQVVSGPSLTAVTALAVLRWAYGGEEEEEEEEEEDGSSDDSERWVIAAGVGSNLHLYAYSECINPEGEEKKERAGKWHWIQVE